MNGASRIILAAALALMALAPRAHAESEQYCLDYVRSVDAQLQRARAAKCDVHQWGASWSSDTNEHFAFCRNSDAGTIQYVKNQREGQLRLCEINAAGQLRAIAKDFRITGGPGNYRIHWTITLERCPRKSGLSVGEGCFVQIRLDTAPGRAGGYHHDLGVNDRDFTKELNDPYPGQPGDVVRLKWHGCFKISFTPRSCSGWQELPLTMPPAIPEFHPARIVALNPAEFTPRRFISSKGQMKIGTRDYARETLALKLRLDGTNVSFTPAPFQYPNGSWDPEVQVHLWHGQHELYTSKRMRFPAGGVQRIDVPVSVLDAVECGPSVGATGHCATLDVEVASFKHWTSGDIKDQSDLQGKSRTQLRIVTPMAEKTALHQVQATAPRILSAAGLTEPPRIISACGTTYRVSSVGFTARQSNVERSRANQVRVELQYAAGQGLWDNSSLLTTLPAVANSKPPEYRASLAIGQLAKTASSWRWRVRAVDGARTSQWCNFTVAALPGGAATTSQKVSPAMLSRMMEVGWNRYGSDYRGFDTNEDARKCQTTCASEVQCKAWTWVKPGVQGPSAKCWLKNAVPPRTQDQNTTSGLR